MKLTTLLGLIAGLSLLACSQINTKSQDHYANKKLPKHGFKPVVTKKGDVKPAPKKLDPEVVKQGEFLYQRFCFSCHGKEGRGDGPMSEHFTPAPKDLVALAKRVPHFKFFMLVSQWNDDMPGWDTPLSEREVADIEQYILSLAQKK
jgi:mono/diheme cytochrome c family protein